MFTRRHLLRTLGATALGLPLLESVMAPAHANGAFPTRLVVVCRGQGTLPSKLVIPGTSPTDFTLGPILDPLTPFKDRMVIAGNVNDGTNILDGSYNGHTRCLLHTWSARGMVWSVGSDGTARPTSAGGITLDQQVAAHWAGSTPYSSLEFGVGADTQPIQTFWWKGVGQPVPPENSVSAMNTRLFEDLVGSDPTEIANRAARRDAVLTAVAAQFDTVLPRVSSQDRVKLQNHLAGIESVQASLSAGGLGDACTAPAVDLSASTIPERSTAMIDMLTMALACDLTRVATLSFGDFQSWPWLADVDFPSGWHDAVHAGPVTLDLEDDLTDSYRWYSTQVAALLAALDAVPEGAGTMLDNTLVVVGNVFSTGSNHSASGKTYLLFGGGGGLVGGRNLDLQGAHNADLFTSILQALGLPDDRFGDPGFASGPLSGVIA